VVVVPEAVVVDHRPVVSPGALTRPLAANASAWRAYVERHGPALMRDAAPLPPRRLRIALTTAAPSEKVAHRWGDWHLAQAFARSLRRLGHVVHVQTFDHSDDLATRVSDIHCVLRGLRRVRRSSGQAHVLWIISHPDTIEVAECDEADLVLVASHRFAEELRSRTRTPVEVMLQATDATRFRPMSADPRHAHDVAVIAKSRDVYRSAVADAISVGLRPAIYGTGWDAFVDRALIASDYVPNEELPVVYSSIRVLLNDHWQDMRDWGFVSNRLFDALACGTPVISDHLPEIAELFDDVVRTYRDPGEIRALVEATLTDAVHVRDCATRGRERILQRHTFDHRAEEFAEALRRHRLDPTWAVDTGSA
jgi:glycosyltransferase involved in cell wall biosynthesis